MSNRDERAREPVPRPSIIFGFVLALLTVGLGGCGTFANGIHEQLTITSSPPGATVNVWPTGETVTTPAELSLLRRRTYMLRYHLDGYNDESVQVSHVSSEAVIMDFPLMLLGFYGLFGLAVDYSIGGAFRLKPNPVHADLRSLDHAQLYPKIVVALPADLRSHSDGKPIAGTTWECGTDRIYGADGADFARGRLAVELRDSGLFDNVGIERSQEGDLVWRTDLVAFCSQSTFLNWSTAGMTALDVTIEAHGESIFRGHCERVVTDSDPEFRGEVTASPEQVRRSAMRDSLRVCVGDILARLRADVSPSAARTTELSGPETGAAGVLQ